MTSLLIAKQYLKYYITRYEAYLVPLARFGLAFAVLLFVNRTTGYMARLDSLAIVFVAALTCSFMPPNFTILMSAVFIVAHLHAASLECAVAVAAIFLLLFLLFYRFSPRDSLVVLLTPICFVLKIPYVIPLALGFLSTPLAIVSATCGIIVYYTVSYITGIIPVLSLMAADDMAVRFRFIVDGFMDNRTMLVMIAAFAATIIVVWLIRRLPMDRSWTIATITGSLVHILVLLLGDLAWDTTVNVWGAIVGTAVSICLAKVIEFFTFHVDFKQAENVQFEDDEYYYYVKAVPKITVATPSRKVKKIHSPRLDRAGKTKKAEKTEKPDT